MEIQVFSLGCTGIKDIAHRVSSLLALNLLSYGGVFIGFLNLISIYLISFASMFISFFSLLLYINNRVCLCLYLPMGVISVCQFMDMHACIIICFSYMYVHFSAIVQ